MEYFHPRDFNETNWTKLNVITIKLFVLWGSVFKMFCILRIQFISHVLQIPENCSFISKLKPGATLSSIYKNYFDCQRNAKTE